MSEEIQLEDTMPDLNIATESAKEYKLELDESVVPDIEVSLDDQAQPNIDAVKHEKKKRSAKDRIDMLTSTNHMYKENLLREQMEKQELLNYVQDLENQLTERETILVDTYKDNLVERLAIAEAAYKEAYEKGRVNELTTATKAIAKIQNQLDNLSRLETNNNRQPVDYQPQYNQNMQQPYDYGQAYQQPPVDNYAAVWARNNPMYYQNPQFKNQADMIADQLYMNYQQQGYGHMAYSKQFYDDLDRQLNMTNYRQMPNTTPTKANISNAPKTIKLTAEEMAIARGLPDYDGEKRLNDMDKYKIYAKMKMTGGK